MAERHKHHIFVEADTEVAVNIGDPADGRWFKMWHSLIESGKWASLTSAAAKVYPVLAKHSDKQWLSWPSTARIMKLTGLSRPSVFRAIADLERQGRRALSYV